MLLQAYHYEVIRAIGGILVVENSTSISVRHFRLRQLAEMSGLSTATLRRAISAGRLASKKIGTAILIDEAEAQRFLSGKGSPRSEEQVPR